jgi:putative flippase GtrA
MTVLHRSTFPGATAAAGSHRPAAGAPSSRPDGRAANPANPGRGLGGEVVVFAAIGILSTAAYAVLYLAFRSAVGATAANALALVLTAVANTAANRRLTFGVRGRRSIVRDQVGGLVALAIALAITTASVSLLGALVPRAGRLVELAVLVVANALATIVRFVLLRSWIAGEHRAAVATNLDPQE